MGPGGPRAKGNVGQRDYLEKTTACGADPYSSRTLSRATAAAILKV